MPTCRFKVVSIAAEPNVRGQEMRRIKLVAADSEPFKAPPAVPAAAGQKIPPAPPADGAITMLVNVAFAKTLDIGDELALEKRP